MVALDPNERPEVFEISLTFDDTFNNIDIRIMILGNLPTQTEH